MTDPINEQLEQIQERLTGLSDDLEARAARIAKGDTVELADLQSRIGDISVDMINARPDSACFLPSLKQIVAQLDDLALTLKKQHDAYMDRKR